MGQDLPPSGGYDPIQYKVRENPCSLAVEDYDFAKASLEYKKFPPGVPDYEANV